MAKHIDVSVLNETTLLVKDVTVEQRFQAGNFGEVVSDIVYVSDTDSTKTLQFATSFNTDKQTQIYVLPSKSLQSTAKVEITWMYGQDGRYSAGTYTMNSDRFGKSGVYRFKDIQKSFARVDKSIVYRVKFMDGLKFDQSKGLYKFASRYENFVINKVANEDRYDSGVGLDFTFLVDGREIKASKYILSANSHVFDAMFNNDWKDSREGRVDIVDVEFEVMDTFIRALHGIEMKLKDITMAIKLMIVADMYQVERLQFLAETYVKNGIRGDSVIGALVVSHQLGISDVQEKCLRFIAKSNKPLAELVGYDRVPREVSILMFETLYKNRVPLK